MDSKEDKIIIIVILIKGTLKITILISTKEEEERKQEGHLEVDIAEEDMFVIFTWDSRNNDYNTEI